MAGGISLHCWASTEHRSGRGTAPVPAAPAPPHGFEAQKFTGSFCKASPCNGVCTSPAGSTSQLTGQPAKPRNPSTACQEKSSTLTTATAGQKCHARMWVRGALLPRIQHIYLSLQKTNTVRRGTAAVSLRGPTQGRGTHEACSGEEAAPGPNPANPHCQLHEWLLSPLQQPAGSSGHRQAAG